MRRIVAALFLTAIIAACSDGLLMTGADTEAEPRQTFGVSKCKGGDANNWSYCTTDCLCAEGDGDCDRDDHCEGDLVCRRNVGKHFGVDSRMDFCLPKDWQPGDPSCKAGQQLCGDKCVNTDEDRSNCGACGQVCPDGTICGGNGFCKACDEDLMVCGNSCVDTEADAKHCGGCGNICPLGTACEEAVCKVVQPKCGDGVCEAGEDCQSCQQDCCPFPPACGDGTCEVGEDCKSCQADCGKCGCAADADCDDGESCTEDTCDVTTGLCKHKTICGGGGCGKDSDCSDGNACTTDTCDAATGQCTNSPISGCCTADSDCGDGNACTTDTCDVATGKCSNGVISGCCNVNSDCDDGDSCTEDTCNANNTCEHKGSCCTPDCSAKLCGAADGCGGTCGAGSGCCTPSCSGKSCGEPDGCGGTCSDGSGCTSCPTSPCDLVQQCGCSDGQACTTTYQPDGSTECRGVTKNGTDLDTCAAVEECAKGYLCMGIGGSWNRCKPFCKSDTDCAGNRSICRLYNKGAAGDTNFCTSNCDPMSDDFFVSSQSPNCPAGYQCHALRDAATGRGLSDCAKMGTATILESCSSAADCDWGMNCVFFSGGGMCMQECRVTSPGSQCMSPTTCVPYNNKIVIGGVEYGYCALP